jgi:conjugal transfer ATP-binding protein TraC
MIGLLTELTGFVFGSGAKQHTNRSTGYVPSLAEWLPYRSFDPKTQLFYNSASTGFVVEYSPFVGGDDQTQAILTQFLGDVPELSHMQFISYLSPRVSHILDPYFVERFKAGGIFQEMARHRVDHLSQGVWGSLSADAPFHLHDFRTVFAFSVPPASQISNETILALRDSFVAALQSMNIHARNFTPIDLIAFVDDILSPTRCDQDDPVSYNQFDPLSEQMVRRDTIFEVQPDRIGVTTARYRARGVDSASLPKIGVTLPDRFELRAFAPRAFPLYWRPGDAARLNGDLWNDKLRPPCGLLTSLVINIPDEQALAAKAGYKALRTTTLADSRQSRFTPQVKAQSAEWLSVQSKMREGQKLVELFYSVTMIAPQASANACERTLKALYKAAGWPLEGSSYLQMQNLLASLPMTAGNGLTADLKRQHRFKTVLTSNAATLAPTQGEYRGGSNPQLLLASRRGQPFFWSPFENASGNHNVAIIGKSGSGKSVLMQDLFCSLAASGANVIIIDDGRSFETSVKLLGGQFVEFTALSGTSFSPFRMIDAAEAHENEDYRLDCMAMLKAMFSCMARFQDRLNDLERGLIDRAVNEVWEQYGNRGSIDHVMAALRSFEGEESSALATAMQPFSLAGSYGQMFSPDKDSFKLDGTITAFELSDLATKPELRSVLLTCIMFMSSQAMRKDRSVRKALMLDEAWQLLQGGAMAEFVESYARTCRKYGGSLITATQSYNDYSKSDGAKAALENSDWMLVLQQKAETINEFRNGGKFDLDDHSEAVLRSLRRHGNEYSEVLIFGPDHRALGRLILDPFSAAVFSSTPDTFAHIQRLVASGMTLVEAVTRVAWEDGAPDYDSEDLPLLEAAE